MRTWLRSAVFDALARLVDKSLVVHDPDTGWYRLLETLRLYAIDRCADAGDLQPLRDTHAHWWSTWLDGLGPEAPSDTDIDTIDHAYPNLRAALEWAATTHPTLALELAGGLGIYWYLHGLLGDAVTLGDLALDAGRDTDPEAWARTVGLIANARRYASDTAFFNDSIPEACRIADHAGDPFTPLRCRAAPVLSIGTLAEFEELAHTARQIGDRWVEARMLECVALWRSALMQPDDPDVQADLAALKAIAHELDASTFRVAHHIVTAQRIAPDNLAAAVEEATAALPLLDRASSTNAMVLIRSLAWYGVLRGDREAVSRAANAVRRLARDWGILTPLARAVAELPVLLDGALRWEGPLPVLSDVTTCSVGWLWSEIAGDNVISLEGREIGPVAASGELWQLQQLLRETRAVAARRYRDAEPGVAELVRRRYEDQHLWLLTLARCAADTGSLIEAARLLGAVATHQEQAGAPWLPRMLRTAREETEEIARTTLGDTAFETAVAEGRALELQEAVAYALRARGQRKRPTSGWDSLTPTELQVAEQVAAGHTNAEIATALLMGLTTVKTHLAHIFTKLGCTNRGQLAAEASTAGLDRPGLMVVLCRADRPNRFLLG